MSNKNVNIVDRKKKKVNNKEIKDSLITIFLLPSSILSDDKKDKIEDQEKSYSFLENESNGLLYKFKKSIPYFQKLKDEFINKNYIVESDDFFEINSIDLFALQTITEFINNRFTYSAQKNYYKVLFEDTEFFELSEKIIALEKYVVSLSDLFNIIENNLFDLSSAMTNSIDEYIAKFSKDKIVISNLLFGRSIKLQDLIKKIKLCSYETDKRLIEKIKNLELEYDSGGFLYKDDFLKFLFYIMAEIKNLFASIINDIVPAINVLWENYEIELEEARITEIEKEEKQKELSLIEKIKNVKIPKKNDVEKLKSISLPKNEVIFEVYDDSNKDSENSEIIIEEYDFSNNESNYKDFVITENEDEFIEWDENPSSKYNSYSKEESSELEDDSWLDEDGDKISKFANPFNNEEDLDLEDDSWLDENGDKISKSVNPFNNEEDLDSEDDSWLDENGDKISKSVNPFNNEKNSNIEDDGSFNEEDLEKWNSSVNVNDEEFESKQNEINENNFINETEDLIYNNLINEINDIDDEETITKNMDNLINEIKDSIEKESNDNSNEESEY